MKITAVFEPCDEGGYHAFIREIPGVHSQGETIEETSRNLADAFREIIAYRLESGLEENWDVVGFEIPLIK
jgi:predicted RNase H-like HicB family nuclease